MHTASTLSPSVSRLLPAQPTPLVGRADELATIRRRLADEGTRLLTLVGPAGVGKTRLALAAAADAEVAGHFPDGVAWVDLAQVREPPLVLPTVARTLGLTDTGQLPLGERLDAFLRERGATLLVLDTCEQVLPAAGLLADLLAACPGLALLVTSRVPLGLRWERALRVAPLAVPDLQAALPPLDALARIPSVALFVERARAHRADFALTERQAPLVAEVVARLDGLPLALELAAARLDVLSLPALARRLGDRLRLLASAAPDRPERQRSLEAAVGWSYDLLGEPERRLFRCLGVFAGRVTLDAIVTVVCAVGAAGGDAGDRAARAAQDAGHTLQRLLSLAEKSLVLPLPERPDELGGQPGPNGHDGELAALEEAEDLEPAFGMLETVRAYARERLDAAGELDTARRAHARYFTALAERADPHLRQHGQRAWFFRLEREHDNLRAALRWLLDQDDPAAREAGLRLTTALCYFWWARGHHAEAWRWQEEALERAPVGDAADPAVRTRALIRTGMYRIYGGELDRAKALLEEALALAQLRRDPADTAEALNELGARALFAGDWAESARLVLGALARWEGLGDPHYVGNALLTLGAAALMQGDYAGAAPLFAEALERFEAAGDARIGGDARLNLGVIAHELGDLPRAARHIREGLEASVTLRDRRLLSVGIWAALAVLGERPDPAQRARLLGAADALTQATGATLGVFERGPGGQSVARLRERLGQGEWEAAYREGRALPFGEVATLALTLLEEFARALPQPEAVPVGAQQPAQRPQQPTQRPQQPGPLSAREAEVLRLVAQGLSNKAIGRALFLSPSTVNFHLTSAFHKLGVETRAQAVAVAAQRGLL